MSRSNVFHKVEDFAPISRFHPDEVQQTINIIEDVLKVPSLLAHNVNDSLSMEIETAHSKRDILRLSPDQITYELFDTLWYKDDPSPFIVYGVTAQSQYTWNPQFFIEVLGETRCDIEDCKTGKVTRGFVKDFFSCFGKGSENGEVWRLRVSYLSLSSLHTITVNSCIAGLATSR